MQRLFVKCFVKNFIENDLNVLFSKIENFNEQPRNKTVTKLY